MITRLSADTACLDDRAFEELARVLTKQRVYTVTASADSAKRLAAGLNQRGYVTEVKPAPDGFRVLYTGDEPRIRVADAGALGLRADRDGLYKALTREAGLYDYEFDDGAVWKVQSFEDGDYLVKVVDDEDEERVVWQAAASAPAVVTSANYVNALRMLYGEVSAQLLNDVEHDAALRTALVNMLNRRVTAKVLDVLRMHRLGDKALTPQLAATVAEAQVTSAEQLVTVVTKHLLATGRRG